MPLIVPIRAEHIRAAYADAQEDPDGFIHREIQRLRDAHPLLAAQIEGTFDMHMRHDGHSMAGPFALGSTIGSVAVGRCTNETGDRHGAQLAYAHNLRLGRELPNGVAPPSWNTEAALDQLFGDREVTDAFLEIEHPLTRAAAASTVGYLCLDRIPTVPALAPVPAAYV